jgi:MarR family 2-MHQ and catechol resistance regulon transcriptional repressor
VKPDKKEKAERRKRRALDAYGRLQRAAAVTAAAADASLARFGLSASQLGVLETLDQRGPLHQQEIARTLGRSKAQMTAIIDALEKRGLVRRERHATDRRYTTVTLTDEGRALLAEAAPVRGEAVLEAMRALSGDQRTRLARLCRRLIRALSPEDAARDGDETDDGGDAAGPADAEDAAAGAAEEPAAE